METTMEALQIKTDAELEAKNIKEQVKIVASMTLAEQEEVLKVIPDTLIIDEIIRRFDERTLMLDKIASVMTS